MKTFVSIFLFFHPLTISAQTSTSLNVAMSDVKPISYRENEEYQGLNYKILKQIESITGIKFNYTLYPHARILNELPTINSDVAIMFQTACEKFSNTYESGEALYFSNQTIYVKKGIVPSDNLRIGRITGTCRKLMDENIKKEFQIDVASLDQAMEMIKINRLDGVCGVEYVLKFTLKDSKISDIFTISKSSKVSEAFSSVLCLKKSLPENIKDKIKHASKKINIQKLMN